MSVQLPDFSQAKPVLIYGDVMLDRYWSGPTGRISPEAPVPVVHIKDVQDRPGGAGNVALNVSALRCPVSLFGFCGNDDAADALRTQLKAAHIDGDLITIDHMPTITKLRVLSVHQQLIRLDFEENFNNVDNSSLKATCAKSLKGAGALILSDYGKGMVKDPRSLIAEANAQGIPVLVDPKSTSFAKYTGATLVTPNRKEFEAVVGPCTDENALISKAIALCSAHQIKALLVTLGSQGMTLIRPGYPALHLPSQAREVFDVTGAGDTVIGIIAASLAASTDLPTATALANVAAGIVVGKLGAATVTISELRDALGSKFFFKQGIVNHDRLKQYVIEAKARGETVVMTNGCFDILHAGHVAYLEEAKKLGHRLIVAVNDDESIRRLKGQQRPINGIANRMAILAALEVVDWVISFSEDTPEQLINDILPSILVKGGDWAVDDIVGSKAVLANGGQVKSLAFHTGLSTSNIVQRIVDISQQ
ncbi:MAG: bifunctional D-glycero-beta-D-manno-heptose-7-phosphate kinase/D-glycero-beta-D-manno-heptose 1-phosphate adenylyltransferase HldE [Gammaproteobacteria bacterium]